MEDKIKVMLVTVFLNLCHSLALIFISALQSIINIVSNTDGECKIQ